MTTVRPNAERTRYNTNVMVAPATRTLLLVCMLSMATCSWGCKKSTGDDLFEDPGDAQDAEDSDKERRVVEWIPKEGTIKVGKYRVHGTFPRGWSMYTLRDEIRWRKENDFPVKDPVAQGYSDSRDFCTFAETATEGDGCDPCFGQIGISIKKCSSPSCRPNTAKDEMILRPGVWSNHWERKRVCEAPGRRMSVTVIYAFPERGETVWCQGLYSCDKRLEIGKHMLRTCENLKITAPTKVK